VDARIRGRRVAAIAAGAALLGAASPAAGKVWFQHMEGRRVESGARVATVIAGCPGNPSCRTAVEGTVVYLRPVGRRCAITTAGCARRLGRVDANGRLAFHVPHLPAGRYRFVARVRTALGLRTFNASGPFRIIARRS